LEGKGSVWQQGNALKDTFFVIHLLVERILGPKTSDKKENVTICLT
jgi:hypothetical protein